MHYFLEQIKQMSHQNKYTKWYCDIIHQAQQRSQEIQGEKHHIVPRSIDPESILNDNNIVKLSYREHYIAHLLLPKMLKNKQYKMKMYNAIIRLCNGLIHNSKREPTNLYASRKYHTIRTMVYNSGVLSKTKDTIWVNNTKTSKRINQTELDEFLLNGWELGRKSFNRKTSIYINKDGTTKRIDPKMKNQFLLDGWSLGKSPRKTICVTNGKHNIYVLPDEIPEGYAKGSYQKTQKGRKWITNGKEDIYLLPNEDIPNGWTLGRSNKKIKICYNTNANKIKINNGNIQKFIPEEEPIPEGWVKGGLSQKKKWKWSKKT